MFWAASSPPTLPSSRRICRVAPAAAGNLPCWRRCPCSWTRFPSPTPWRLRRWTALAGAVAAACLAVGLAVGPLLARPPQPDATYSVVSGGGLRVNIDMARKTWGTELAVSGSSLPADGTLSLWVRDRAGGEDRACAWTATPSGKVKVTGATPIQLGSISSVELRDGAQHAVAVITVP